MKLLALLVIFIGIILLVTGFTLTTWLKPFYWTWIAFSIMLSWIMTRLIIVFLFYLVVTPIALVAKLVRKNFLQLGQDNSDISFWIYREKDSITKETIERQF